MDQIKYAIKHEMNEKIVDKQKMIIIVLAIGLFLFVQYYLLDKWMNAKEQEMIVAYQNGYQRGLGDATHAIFQNTQNCKETTLTIGNLTKQVFDVSCLKNNTELKP